ITATLNILDKNNGGVIQFVNASQTVAENVLGSVVNLALSRTGTNLAGGIQVDYTLSGNTSAVASALNGSVTFAATVTTASIPVTIVNAGGAQLDREVVVTLSNPRSANAFTGPNSPTLGAKAATTLKITDTLPHVQLSAASYSVTEGGTATIAVTRTGPLTGAVVVNYATADGT